MSDLTAAEKRAYVEERWELVHHCDGSYRDFARGTVLIQDRHNHWLDFPDYSAAYDFTLQREEEIRLVKEELTRIYVYASDAKSRILFEMAQPDEELPYLSQEVRNLCALARVHAKLESELATLRHGMKEEK
jgi:hypothetical protein